MLGEGGMAVVYRVRHQQLDTRHALKILTVPSRKIQDRLIQEGKVQAALRHPNIVQVTDIINVNGAPGLVMEYIAGPSLDTLIKNVDLELDHVDALARGILAGVQAAHEQGVLHRDLKPANILLDITDEGLVPKVADFGLAKLVGQSTGGTRTGATMGTPSYMAPEQIEDAKAVDARADIFSLGAILYELATGRRAFEGENIYAILCKVKEGDYTPPDEVVSELPECMVAAIQAALQVDVEERVQSVEELQEIWRGNTTTRRVRPEVWDPKTLSEAHSVSEQERLEEQASLGEPPADGTFQLNDATGRTGRKGVTISATGPVPIEVGTFYQERPNAPTPTPTIEPPEEEISRRTSFDQPTRRLEDTLEQPPGLRRFGVAFAAVALLLLGVGMGVFGLPLLQTAPAPTEAPPPPVPVISKVTAEPGQPQRWANTALDAESPEVAEALAPVAQPPPDPTPRTKTPVAERAPEPPPPPAPRVGSVTVKGDVQSAHLVGANGRFSPGELPVGSYHLEVVFPDGFAIKAPYTVEVASGDALTIKCSSVAQNCTPPK